MSGDRSSTRHSGIGMTSQRTRLRMIERLRAKGIRDDAVLGVMLNDYSINMREIRKCLQ